jgi:hypothetical protein
MSGPHPRLVRVIYHCPVEALVDLKTREVVEVLVDDNGIRGPEEVQDMDGAPLPADVVAEAKRVAEADEGWPAWRIGESFITKELHETLKQEGPAR